LKKQRNDIASVWKISKPYFVSGCIKVTKKQQLKADRLCGLVVRVSGYRYGGPEFDSWRFQVFWEAVGPQRGPLSLVRTTEELLGINSSGFGQENRD
jgi:hypothetical protein